MWQKARILNYEEAEANGRTIWTESQPRLTASISKGGYCPPEPMMKVNIVSRNHPYCAIPLHNLELLPEFAEDVPLISWEEFLKGDV